jgi:hypothetical protein
MYAARVCTWGYLFVQNILDTLFPGCYPHPTIVNIQPALWDDLNFWDDVLGSKFSLWMGVRQHMVAKKDIHINKDNFATQFYSDASKTFGVGGVMGTEIYSARWTHDTREDHIGLLELRAVEENLKHFKHNLKDTTVLAWVDNVQALSAINKGYSRLQSIRQVLHRIALMGLEFNFELKAKFVKGTENPADAPSRGKQNTTQDWTFRDSSLFNNPPAEIDCCTADDGHNSVQSCTTWYAASSNLQDNVKTLAGHRLWANVPFNKADQTLDAIVSAWKSDPANTVATVVVPEWTTATWYRKYMRRRQPLFKVLKRYAAGSRCFLYKRSMKVAPPCAFPVLVLRLGS